PRAPSTSLGMTETGPASIFLLLEPLGLGTTIVRNEIQVRCGYSRRRTQRSCVGRVPGARGVKRSAPGEERLHRRRYHVAEGVPRLRCQPLALLVPGQPFSRENYSRLGTEPRAAPARDGLVHALREGWPPRRPALEQRLGRSKPPVDVRADWKSHRVRADEKVLRTRSGLCRGSLGHDAGAACGQRKFSASL